MLILINHLHFVRSDLLTKFPETLRYQIFDKIQRKIRRILRFLTFLLLESTCPLLYLCLTSYRVTQSATPTQLHSYALYFPILQFHTYITYCTVHCTVLSYSTLVIDIILNCTAMNIHYTTQ